MHKHLKSFIYLVYVGARLRPRRSLYVTLSQFLTSLVVGGDWISVQRQKGHLTESLESIEQGLRHHRSSCGRITRVGNFTNVCRLPR